MRDQGYTDVTLAKRIGCSPRTVQDWRLGAYHPKLAHVLAACDALDVEPSHLLSDAPLLKKLA